MSNHILVACCFCSCVFRVFIDPGYDRKHGGQIPLAQAIHYQVDRDTVCPHCYRRIIPGKVLRIIPTDEASAERLT